MIDLAKIRARAEAATPAEQWGQQWGGTLGRGEIRVGPPGAPAVSRFMFTALEFGNAGTAHPDFQLVINAPADIRALVARCEALEAALDRIVLEAASSGYESHDVYADIARAALEGGEP